MRVFGLEIDASLAELILEKLEAYWEKTPTWVAVIVPTLFIYYKYFTWNFGIFKKLGIKGPRPWPVVGTMGLMMKEGIMEHDLVMTRKYGKLVGTFQGRIPCLLIYDVEILKQILIKDFATFPNRFVPDLKDYPIEKFITFLKDENWKHVRNVMTPTFSAGKLRKMNQPILECAETLLNNLEQKCKKDEVFDFRELCGAYTMDVIANTAFSLRIDSHNDPNNKFVEMGKKSFKFTFANPKMIILFFFPFLLKPLGYIKFSVFPKDAMQFFLDVIERAMAERTSEDKSRTDFLQLLINAMKEDNSAELKAAGKKELEAGGTWTRKGLTLEEALAQSLIFFLAGYETVANAMSLLVYCLATNPECQDKVIREIDEVMNGETQVTYDLIQKMNYLEMCFNESQRLYPTAPRTDRMAKEDFQIDGLFIPKGTMIGVPIYALHVDPEVWSEPHKYIPERFLPEAKESRSPYSFMPFGQGPRNCVGMRLALTEIKIALVHVLMKYKFVTCSETEVPLVIDKLSVKGKNGIKLKVERRTKTSPADVSGVADGNVAAEA